MPKFQCLYPVTKNNIFGIILNNSNVFLFSISGRQKKRPLLDAKKGLLYFMINEPTLAYYSEAIWKILH